MKKEIEDKEFNMKPCNMKQIGSFYSINEYSEMADSMYICVKQTMLEKKFKRPIFIIGPHSERIQIALEKQNSKMYKFSVHEDIPLEGILSKITNDSQKVHF